MRILAKIVNALYPPPKHVKNIESHEVDLDAVTADLDEALDWLSTWYPDDNDDGIVQDWIDWLDEV
jgi:hypothetical protein